MQGKPAATRGPAIQQGQGKTPSSAAAAAKKKLFLTDGWQLPLTGICIYMFRLNTGKQLPEEGFHKVSAVQCSAAPRAED